MPILYDQSEYEMAGALRQKPYPIFNSAYSGLDIPWGSELVIEGHIKSRVLEIEGPFGEFTGHYSGGRMMPLMDGTRGSYLNHLILAILYIPMPFPELSHNLSLHTSPPIH